MLGMSRPFLILSKPLTGSRAGLLVEEAIALGYPLWHIKLSLEAYKSTSFIAATDVERVPQATMSGYNTSGGQQITASWKKFGNATNNRAQKTFVVCHHDAVLQLSSTSAQVHT